MCHADTFTVNTHSLENYQKNCALFNIKKSADIWQQKSKLALKQQAASIQHQREHLSNKLLEIIQTILFIIIWCRAPN